MSAELGSFLICILMWGIGYHIAANAIANGLHTRISGTHIWIERPFTAPATKQTCAYLQTEENGKENKDEEEDCDPGRRKNRPVDEEQTVAKHWRGGLSEWFSSTG